MNISNLIHFIDKIGIMNQGYQLSSPFVLHCFLFKAILILVNTRATTFKSHGSFWFCPS